MFSLPTIAVSKERTSIQLLMDATKNSATDPKNSPRNGLLFESRGINSYCLVQHQFNNLTVMSNSFQSTVVTIGW